MCLARFLQLTILVILHSTSQKLNADTAPLKVVIKPAPPFIMADKDEGYSVELLQALMIKTGHAFTLQRTDTVANLISKIEKGEADLGIAAITINATREQIIDFSQPIFTGGLQILVPAESGQASLDWDTFIELMKVFGFLFFSMLVVAHFVWFLEHKSNEHYQRDYLHGIWDGIWWATVTLSTVGYGDKYPKKIAGRIVAIIWMLAGIFLIAYFTSTITSVLTVQRLSGTINSPSDLAGHVVGTVDKTAPQEFLHTLHINPVAYPSLEALQKALINKEVEAIVYDAPMLEYFANSDGKGKVKVAGRSFKKEHYGIAFPKNSPYREEINVALLSLIEDGTIEKIRSKWFGTDENQ